MQQTLTLQDLVDDLDKPRVRTSDVWRIVVVGEFQSGKSSVINALLRAPVLPTDPGLAGRPLIKITHTPAPSLSIVAEDTVGRIYKPADLDELCNGETLSSCEIKMELGQLEGVEIVEVPFQPDTGISKRDLDMIADADLMIWVTIASQAWRLSEKALVERLPYDLRERSILAISRADKLRSADDFDKIERRLQKDASPFFSEIVFMQASMDTVERSIADTRMWEESGGAALASIAQEIVVTQMRAEQAVVE